MTVRNFYLICSALWLTELLIWIYAFEKNIPINYLGAFAITMMLGAIMHCLGIKVTYDKYEEDRVRSLISLGVPGFDGIQGIIVTIAYCIFYCIS